MHGSPYQLEDPRRWVFGSLLGHVGALVLFSFLGAAFLAPPKPLQMVKINLQTLEIPAEKAKPAPSVERAEPVVEKPKPVEKEVVAERKPDPVPPPEIRAATPVPTPDPDAGLPEEDLALPEPEAPEIDIPEDAPPTVTPEDVDFLEPAAVQKSSPEAPAVSAPDPEEVAPGAIVQASASEGVEDTYLILVQQKIGRRWRPTDAGTRGQREVGCVVTFRIGPAGDVIAPTVMRSSGLSVFDRSALSAVVNSAPLPRPPARFGATGLEINFLFNYSR